MRDKLLQQTILWLFHFAKEVGMYATALLNLDSNSFAFSSRFRIKKQAPNREPVWDEIAIFYFSV